MANAKVLPKLFKTIATSEGREDRVVRDPAEVRSALGLASPRVLSEIPIGSEDGEEDLDIDEPVGVPIVEDIPVPDIEAEVAGAPPMARPERAPRAKVRRTFSVDPEQQKVWDWLKKTTGYLIFVKVSKRNEITKRFEYLPGANIPLNPDVDDPNQIEDQIANSWGGGEYRVTYAAPRGSGLDPLTYYISISNIGLEKDKEEDKPQTLGGGNNPVSITIPQTGDKTANAMLGMMQSLLQEQQRRMEQMQTSFMDMIKAPQASAGNNGITEALIKGFVDMMSRQSGAVPALGGVAAIPQDPMALINGIVTIAKQMSELSRPTTTVAESINMQALQMLLESTKSTKPREELLDMLKLGLELARTGQIPKRKAEEEGEEEEEKPRKPDFMSMLSGGLEALLNRAGEKIGDNIATQASAALPALMSGAESMVGRVPQQLMGPPRAPQRKLRVRPNVVGAQQPQQQITQPQQVQQQYEMAIADQIARVAGDLESDKSAKTIAEELLPMLNPMAREIFKQPFEVSLQMIMPTLPSELKSIVERNQSKILDVYTAIQEMVKT